MTRSQRPRLVGAKASAVLWIGANDATQARIPWRPLHY